MDAQGRAQQNQESIYPVSQCPCASWNLTWPGSSWAEQGRDSRHLRAPSSSRLCKGQLLELKQEKMNETILNPP